MICKLSSACFVWRRSRSRSRSQSRSLRRSNSGLLRSESVNPVAFIYFRGIKRESAQQQWERKTQTEHRLVWASLPLFSPRGVLCVDTPLLSEIPFVFECIVPPPDSLFWVSHWRVLSYFFLLMRKLKRITKHSAARRDLAKNKRLFRHSIAGKLNGSRVWPRGR